MADKYIKLCVVSFYSVYLPVRGINLFQLLSDMSYLCLFNGALPHG